MVEVYLFIIVGAVAIIAAAMMLLSENAVHSAMFLILNFACVAFMYLMLDAPFLAIVHIGVVPVRDYVVRRRTGGNAFVAPHKRPR